MHWLTFLGGVVVFIGTLLIDKGRSIQNKEANEQLKQAIHSKDTHIEDLVQGKNTVIQQNEALNNKIAAYQKELEAKQKKIDELEVFAKKDIYRPLSGEIKNKIIASLKSFSSIKEIRISVMDGNNNSQRLRSDLMELFKQSGVSAIFGNTGVSFGSGVSYPQITINENTKVEAQKFCEVLTLYLRTNLNGKIDNNLENGVILIDLFGSPLFHQDGSVEFQ